MTNVIRPSARSRGIGWAALFLILLMLLAAVLMPAWLLLPFKPQTARGLELAFRLRRWSPIVAPIALVVQVMVVIWLWRGARRWWSKTLMVIVVVMALAAAWLTRQNHFEWMFNPLPNPAYASVSDAGFVEDNDKVLAVELNGDAAAYPVRQLAYHHVVQDVVGGVPVVVTY